MLITRRGFLSGISLGALTAPAAAGLLRLAPRNGVSLGCQTNAWRINAGDFPQLLGVLAKLKELGFDGFETGFRNLQEQFRGPAQARAQLEKTGLLFFGIHIFLDHYDPKTQIAPIELIQEVADGAAALGAQRVILSGAGLVRDGKLDSAALKRKTDGLDAAAKYCQAKGLKLAYHNHAPEFQHDGLEIEGLYRQTDPALVDFLTDCGWAWRGGINVPDFFTRHHRRIVGLHLRDFKGDEQVPLGQGEFPIQALASVIGRVGWNGWALSEEERLNGAKPGEGAVAPARETLRKHFGR